MKHLLLHEYGVGNPVAAAKWVCDNLGYKLCIASEQVLGQVRLNMGSLNSFLVLKPGYAGCSALKIVCHPDEEKGLTKDLVFRSDIHGPGDHYQAPGELNVTIIKSSPVAG